MKTVQAIIDLFGGIAKLHNNPIKIEVKGFMPLSIENIGTGPRGMSLVSVMHYYEQHSDLMRDPDMEFEINQEGTVDRMRPRQPDAVSCAAPLGRPMGRSRTPGCVNARLGSRCLTRG